MSCFVAEARAQKYSAQVLRQLNANHARPQHQHIHVVVLHALVRRIAVMAEPGADSRDLVGCNGRAYSASADQDPALGCNLHQTCGYSLRIIRIVYRRRAVCADVSDFVSLLAQEFGQELLQFESGVVGTNSNAHIYFASISRAAATRFSGVSPNFFNSSFNGAEAPNVFMPITRPACPTYWAHPSVEACSTAIRRVILLGRTLSRYSGGCCSKSSHDGMLTTRTL